MLFRSDRIRVYVDGNDKIRGIFKDNEDTIRHETLADEIVYDTKGGTTRDWKINGEAVTLGTEKV